MSNNNRVQLEYYRTLVPTYSEDITFNQPDSKFAEGDMSRVAYRYMRLENSCAQIWCNWLVRKQILVLMCAQYYAR